MLKENARKFEEKLINLKFAERLDGAHSAFIRKLFWIAASPENKDIEEVLQEMNERIFEKYFPDIATTAHYENDRNGERLLSVLVDRRYFGFLAEVGVPEASKFKYKDSKPVSWAVSGGISTLVHVYAESLESLVSEIEKAATAIFEETVKRDKIKTK